jgi:hypothetical protein
VFSSLDECLKVGCKIRAETDRLSDDKHTHFLVQTRPQLAKGIQKQIEQRECHVRSAENSRCASSGGQEIPLAPWVPWLRFHCPTTTNASKSTQSGSALSFVNYAMHHVRLGASAFPTASEIDFPRETTPNALEIDQLIALGSSASPANPRRRSQSLISYVQRLPTLHTE